MPGTVTELTGPVKCILFDSDGTLVDSEHLSFRVMAGEFAALGVALDEADLVREHRGRKLEETLRHLSETWRVTLPEGFIPRFRQRVAEVFSTELQPVPGVIEVLETITQDVGVVSSGPLAKIRHALGVTGLDRYFDGRVYSSYEIGIWKPDPGIYAYAARDMGYAIDECVAIEDSPVGLEAAAGSGMRTFFLNRFGESCARDGVIEIRAMAELPGLL
jgi:HAD superfamily hydrolase (TIGR01509 family)